MKILEKLFLYLKPLKNLRYPNNTIYIVDKSGLKKKHPPYLPISGYDIIFKGNNNIVEITDNITNRRRKVFIKFYSSDNNVKFGANISGEWYICAYEGNGKLEVGDNTSCCSIYISLVGNYLKIGTDCMISNNVVFWADGHSVIDANSKLPINLPKKDCIIGNHVWLGERVTILKNAEIPNNCIVGIPSVVTKKFTEPNCLIAGNPALIKKRNINWDPLPPTSYLKQQNIQEK